MEGLSFSTMVIGSLLGGALGGLGQLGGNDKQRKMDELYSKLMDSMPEMSKTPYSKEELMSIADSIGNIYKSGANITAGAVGSSLSESLGAAGVPAGQPSGEIYTSSLAPIIQEGQNRAGALQADMVKLFSEMDAQSKQRLLQLFSLGGQLTENGSDMNGWQKGIAGILQGLNLGATGIGNLAQGWTKANLQNPIDLVTPAR